VRGETEIKKSVEIVGIGGNCIVAQKANAATNFDIVKVVMFKGTAKGPSGVRIKHSVWGPKKRVFKTV